MKSYNSYKNSGVEWIGEIPSHWTVKRLKYIFTPREKKSKTGKEELLSVTIPDGVVRRRDYISNDDHISRSESLVGYKICQEMDLVNNIMKMSFRCLGISNYDGIVSPAYSVFFFKDNGNIPSYWNYLLRTDKYVVEYRKRSKGIQESRMRLYDDYFLDLFSHSPPLPEQQKISNYLDQKTKQIDELIEKIEQKIELLKEKRTSFINHCVTKGLDSNVKMKDSGVEWIGEIPSHWGITKLKYESLRKVQYGLNIESNKYVEEGIRFLRITDIDEDGSLSKTGVYLKEEDVPDEYILEPHDLLFSRSGATVGKSCLYFGPEKSGFAGYLVRFSFHSPVQTKFIKFFSESSIFWDWIQLQSSQSTIENVSGEKYSNLSIPKVSETEMNHIVIYLEGIAKDIGIAIEIETKRIGLLKEYRQSLISEVVTGKIDVREEVLQ